MANTNVQTNHVPTNVKTNWRARGRRKRVIGQIISHIFLLLGSVIFMFPLFWLVSTSLKPDHQMFAVPPILIPNPVKWSNYGQMWQYFPFLKFLKNTLLIVVLGGAGTLMTAPMVAYAFSKLRWPGRDFAFMVLMGTIMLPGQVTMIPLYIFFTKLGWVDTYLPLWVPAWFGGGAFNIFLIRQFLMTIPKEMEESAVIDGANHWTIYWRIMLPLINPVLTTVAIFSFMGAWNDFMGPLIYINNQGKYTLSLGLRLFQQQVSSSSATEYGMMMAATTIMVLPVILFFFLGQRKFIDGVVLTGMKA